MPENFIFEPPGITYGLTLATTKRRVNSVRNRIIDATTTWPPLPPEARRELAALLLDGLDDEQDDES